LVESYRNEFGRVCHRTLYTVGFISFNPDKLVDIQRILNNRLERKTPLFEQTDQEALSIADKYWHEMVSKKKIDSSDHAFEKSKRVVDIDSIKHKDAREIGAEWMCYQALKQLQLKEKLTELNKAILKLQENGFYFEQNLLPVIKEISTTESKSSIKEEEFFTARELEVLQLTAQELSSTEIANQLHISPRTVEQHKKNMKAKTKAKNFIGVIKYALINGHLKLK